MIAYWTFWITVFCTPLSFQCPVGDHYSEGKESIKSETECVAFAKERIDYIKSLHPHSRIEWSCLPQVNDEGVYRIK
jgi:hypothetical protein